MQAKLTSEEELISSDAKRFIVKNKRSLINKFAKPEIYTTNPKYPPTAVFMAGWPGVGKTEFASEFIPIVEKILEKRGTPEKIVHIDTDACRSFIDNYDGAKSHLFQLAASRAVHELFNYVHSKKLNYLLDTTLASAETMKSLDRAVNKGCNIFIEFVYLEPKSAWINTLARREREGRVVPEKVFVDAYFNSIKNVDNIIKKYGDNVTVDIAIKGKRKDSSIFSLKNYEINVKSIEPYLPKSYTEEELWEIIKDGNTEYVKKTDKKE